MEDLNKRSSLNRDSIAAIFLYAQCVVLKYDGTMGAEEPRRSSSTKRSIESSGVRYVDAAGWKEDSQCSASALTHRQYPTIGIKKSV
jgi:hypothetical protein